MGVRIGVEAQTHTQTEWSNPVNFRAIDPTRFDF